MWPERKPDRKNFFYDRAARSRIQNVCTRHRRWSTLTSRLLSRHSLCHEKVKEGSVEGVHTQHGATQVRGGENGGGRVRIQAEVFGSHGSSASTTPPSQAMQQQQCTFTKIGRERRRTLKIVSKEKIKNPARQKRYERRNIHLAISFWSLDSWHLLSLFY